MILRLLSILLAFASLGFGATAEPVVKVVNFSAKWCPLCRVLDPRVEDAVEGFSDQGVVLVKMDMTDLDRSSDQEREAIIARLQGVAASHGAAYLWDWYGGHAGIVEIEDRVQESLVLASKVRPGRRRPSGTDCPAPMNTGFRSKAD